MKKENQIQQSRHIVRFMMTKQEILYNDQYDFENKKLQDLYEINFSFMKKTQIALRVMFNSGTMI
jgi:hypothetical protein